MWIPNLLLNKTEQIIAKLLEEIPFFSRKSITPLGEERKGEKNGQDYDKVDTTIGK
jgi:hypothetical protein